MKELYSEDEQTFTNTNDQSFSPTNSFIAGQVRPMKGQLNRIQNGGENEFRPNTEQLNEKPNNNHKSIHMTSREGKRSEAHSVEEYNQGESHNLNKG